MPDTMTKELTDIEFTPPSEASVPAVVDQTPAPVAYQSEAAALGGFIERAASDPRVDIDKLERLIAMKERMEAHAAKREYDEAMAVAQEEMQPIRANCYNSQTKSKYANYYALDDAIRPIYTKHGFSVSFDSGTDAPENCVRVICRVAHRGGHREEHKLDMPADGKGAKGGDVMTRTHATGAAVTYGKRYLSGMVWNLSISFDDDGNGASAQKPNAREPFAGNTLQQAARDAVNEGLTTDGEDRSTYRVEKIKKARDAGWSVTNKTAKGQLDQIYDYLDMAETTDDVEAILNHNTQAIANSGEAARIAANADKIAQYIASKAD